MRRECTVNVLRRQARARHHAHCGRPEVRVLGRSEKDAASDIAAQGQREMRRVVGGQWTRKPKATHTEGGPHADAWDARAGDRSPTQLAHRRAGRSSESEWAGVAYEARVADADVEPGERASVFGVVSRRPPRACEPGRVAHQLVCLPGPALGAARTPRGGTGWHSEVGRRARREMGIGTAARWHVLESGRVWLDDRRGPSCLSCDGGRARWHTA